MVRHSKLRLSIDHLAIVCLLLARPALDWRSLCYQKLNIASLDPVWSCYWCNTVYYNQVSISMLCSSDANAHLFSLALQLLHPSIHSIFKTKKNFPLPVPGLFFLAFLSRVMLTSRALLKILDCQRSAPRTPLCWAFGILLFRTDILVWPEGISRCYYLGRKLCFIVDTPQSTLHWMLEYFQTQHLFHNFLSASL